MKNSAVIISCLTLAVTGMQASAQMPAERIHVLERGVYRAETFQQRDINAGRVTNTVQNAHLISETTNILAAVGVRFGLRYVSNSSREIKLIIRFPPGGLRDPATQQVSFQSELTVTPAVGVTNYWEYHFENDWELAAGVWNFEFWDRDKKLAEQRFCIYLLGTSFSRPHTRGCGLI